VSFSTSVDNALAVLRFAPDTDCLWPAPRYMYMSCPFSAVHGSAYLISVSIFSRRCLHTVSSSSLGYYIVFLCISVPSMRISGAMYGCCSRMLCATLCAAATRCFVLTCKHAQKLRVIVRLVYLVLFCYIVCSFVRLFVQFYVKLVQRVSFLGISLVKIVFLVACHIVLNNLYQVFILANKI